MPANDAPYVLTAVRAVPGLAIAAGDILVWDPASIVPLTVHHVIPPELHEEGFRAIAAGDLQPARPEDARAFLQSEDPELRTDAVRLQLVR